MSRKDMHRSDWKRVLKKKYTARDVLASGIPCKESLLLIEEVSHPLTINNVAGYVLIEDKGISWLQIALKDAHVWITVMYDQNDRFIQAYFDVTNGNDFSNCDNPTFEDMYLDVVLNRELEIHILDRDELDEALKLERISHQDHEAALMHCNGLIAYLQDHTEDFLKYCSKTYSELKSKI